MINTRWVTLVLSIHLFGFFLSSSEIASAVFLLCFVITASIALLFHQHEVKVRAYRIFDNPANVHKFEQWIENKPELADAITWAHQLPPDDFMTFCRLLVEVRYHKDQSALELVSRHFRREK